MDKVKYNPRGNRVLVAIAKVGAHSTLIIPSVEGSKGLVFGLGKIIAVGEGPEVNDLKVGQWVEFPHHAMVQQKSCVMELPFEDGDELKDLELIYLQGNQVIGTMDIPEALEPGIMTKKELKKVLASNVN
jgi:hypothetical protein